MARKRDDNRAAVDRHSVLITVEELQVVVDFPDGEMVGVFDGSMVTIHTPIGTPQESKRLVWLPRKLITMDKSAQKITMPEELARKNGWM